MKRAIRAHLRDFLAVLGLLVIGIGVGAYILTQQRLRFPFVEDSPSHVWVELQNAAGVTPGQGQTVRVAGMRVGDVGKVELHEGRARVRLDMDSKYERLVRRDATVLLRPRTGLKDMFLALDPGTRSEPPVPEGGTIRVNNTLPDVNSDEILASLDADTRAYLKLLIGGAGKGLRDRGGDLREVFRRLGPLHRDLAAINREVVTRRKNLSRLIHNYGSTVSRLGKEDEDLTALVANASRVFGRLSQEDQQISAAVQRLPSALAQTEEALVNVRCGRPSPRWTRPTRSCARWQRPASRSCVRSCARSCVRRSPWWTTCCRRPATCRRPHRISASRSTSSTASSTWRRTTRAARRS
jgi:phospholipid/cholesterol/gamma-HCH transport system substrate-binding protein